MIFSIWDNEIEKKEKQKKWTDNFRKIGEEVYTFFVDTVIEKGYENREGQWDMSCEITDAMKRKQHILVEAGVGIGKTFAYIVPLLFYHKKYGRPIVIATSTIALQEQLESDINVVENIIGYHPEIILVKGQNHFLCRNRADQFFFHNKNKENNKEIYEEIENGGCERNDWDINISDKIWNQINVREFNPVFCRQNCVHKDYCYYYKMRGELRTTNGIILCNQDLLTINLVKRQNWGNEILTDKFEFVVIDEAHNLENKVRSAFTKEMSYNSLSKTMEHWEGISVEGTALSNLIIFRLPFPVPEPIIDYKIKAADNGLMEVLVPEMIIKLKQGIGRLIRSDKDFGIVSIIDSRVGENSNALYKSVIWESLPIKNRTSDINEVAEFYKKLAE